MHPVGKHHKITGKLAKKMGLRDGTEVHGEETGSVEYLYQPAKYKEGQ